MTAPASLERRPKTIPQFCEFYGFSRPTFYGMVRRKQAPRVLKVGDRGRFITPQAEDEWLAANTHDAHDVCIASDIPQES